MKKMALKAERYLEKDLVRDLGKKMVLLGGPRQVGKTSLAQRLLQKESGVYFNWDIDEHRERLQKKVWGNDDGLLVFDELHKFHRWKNWLKGVFDSEGERHRILVTGSARLDVYKRGGDSLFGRYHYWRLHPITLDEPFAKISAKESFSRLLKVGGFPEPFLDNDETEAGRWRKERFNLLLREDIRDLQPVHNLSALTLFVQMLRSRVGSSVVLHNIERDLQISQKTLKRWLELLESMYLIFVVRPYTKNLARAVLKPPKVYFFDNADVMGDEGARFENLVATHLLKRIHYLEDRSGDQYQLHYIRDKEGREVDFAIAKNGKVIELIEAKWSDSKVSPALQYYAQKLQPEKAQQVVAHLKEDYRHGKLLVQGPIEALVK